METVTVKDVREAFERLEDAVETAGLLKAGSRLELREGGTYSWKLEVVAAGGAYEYLPVPMETFLGDTKRSAWESLNQMTNAVHHGYIQSQNAFWAVADLSVREFETFSTFVKDGMRPVEALAAARALAALDAAELVSA